MADCIDCLAPLGDDEWSVHADRGKCMANLQAAARAMSLRLADTEAALDAERTRAHELAGRFSAAQTALAGAEAELAALRDGTVTLPALPTNAEDERLIGELMARKVEGARRPLGGDARAALGRLVYDESIRAWPGDTHLVAPYEVAAPACEAAAAAVARAVLDAIRAVPWREIHDAYWTCDGIDATEEEMSRRSTNGRRNAEAVRARLLAAATAAAEGRTR